MQEYLKQLTKLFFIILFLVNYSSHSEINN